MRRILAVWAVTILAAACGGGDETPPSQCPAPQAPAGTLAGAGGGLGAFTPAEMGALIVNPTSCTVGPTRVYLAGIFLGFSSFQGLCAPLEAYGFCFDKASATIVGVQIAHGSLVSPQTLPGPGTYPVTVGNPTQEPFTVTSVDYTRTGPAPNCSTVATSNGIVGGNVVIDTVSATQVTGSMDVTFADGSTLAGSFTAAAAPISVDVCQVVAGTCTTPVCVP